MPVIALTAFNLLFYADDDSALSFLAPFWLVLLILGITATVVIFALAAVEDLSAREALVLGARVTGLRLPAALVILFVTGLIPVLILTTTLYFLLPLILMIPGLVATAFSTFVLKAIGAQMPEPNAPTEERLHEKRS